MGGLEVGMTDLLSLEKRVFQEFYKEPYVRKQNFLKSFSVKARNRALKSDCGVGLME